MIGASGATMFPVACSTVLFSFTLNFTFLEIYPIGLIAFLTNVIVSEETNVKKIMAVTIRMPVSPGVPTTDSK